MNSQLYLWEIKRYLAWFTSQVRIENNSGYLDISKYAEGFFIPILNLVFNSEFERLEYIKQNYPAIDLGSKDKKISFQVTSEIGFEKIKNTVTKFIENKLFDIYPELYHLIINEDYKTNKTNEDIKAHIISELSRTGNSETTKVEFLIADHIWNITTLYLRIEQKCDLDQMKSIRDYLEKQYGKVTSLPSFDDILIPYEIAFKAQLEKSNINLPYQFHTPFIGREEDIVRLKEFLNQKHNSILAIVADGGYGKTRLSVELFNRIASEGIESEAYVLNEAAFQCMDFAEQLKTDKQVIVLFDDAHLKPDILNDVIGIANRLDNVKLIITIRKPVYNDTLKVVATHNRVMETIEIERLNYAETLALFRNQLPMEKDIEIRRLADQSKGIPIVILGLCQVVLNGKYKTELSEEFNFIQFVREIKAQVISDIHKKHLISEENIHKTIELISFFSPIKNTPGEISELAKLNNIDSDETSLIIDYLDQYDFINKQSEISIKPDPYSDTILLDAAPRIKYLLQKDIKIFLDRLIRNIVGVEQSQRLDISIDNLLFEFISSFKSKNIDSNEGIRTLENNLDTLKSFTYKKPQLCFLAIKSLLNSQMDNADFWRKHEELAIYSNSFKNIHESIELVLSIVALNSHKSEDLEDIYELLWSYQLKKPDSFIFQKVFRYRVYDFIEYGYRPQIPCERQQFLVNKLQHLIASSPTDQLILDHIFICCKTLLALEFEGESFYDKYTYSYSYGQHYVYYNSTTKAIKEAALKLVLQIYELSRFSQPSEKYFETILKSLFYMAKQKNEAYQYNQTTEVEIVIEFLRHILIDGPNMYERSSIIRQLKLFKKRELKKEYTGIAQEILESAENVKSPKEKLSLLLLDEYFSLRQDIGGKINDLIVLYNNDWNKFYQDLIELKISFAQTGYTNFDVIISHLIENYPAEGKKLLDFVIINYPEQVCDYITLIRTNYKDQIYFYQIIAKIWNLELECTKGSVFWMLTHGRNQEIEFYQESDLEYVEYIVENKLLSAYSVFSFTLAKYILISPHRTINLIAKIIKSRVDRNEPDFLLHSIFDDKIILEKYPELIKEFVFKETIEINLNSHYFEDVLRFLDNTFGFKILFQYLKDKIKYLKDQDGYVSLSLHEHYDNHEKSQIQKETDFITVIEWYSELTEKLEYIHKKLVEYLRPTIIQSEEFKIGFKTLIDNAGDDLAKKITICNTLDVYEEKSEFLISILIEISNSLCQELTVSNENLRQIFGSNYIYNLGMRSGPAGSPFPQDIAKLEELNLLISKYPMHPKVKELFDEAISNVQRAINRKDFDDNEAKW
jgi:hypothetical protein